MKVSRWIYFPLIYIVFYVLGMFLYNWIFDLSLDSFIIWSGLICLLLMGFLTLYSSDTKAREISKNSHERVFEIKQNRTLVLLLNYKRTFNLCKEAILSVKGNKTKNEDFQKGKIKAKSRVNWDVCGENIQIHLKSINENLTEVEVVVRPLGKL